jgi:hypothetical protein
LLIHFFCLFVCILASTVHCLSNCLFFTANPVTCFFLILKNYFQHQNLFLSMSIDYPCICQQPSPWVRFQSFYNFTSLIRERLKSYPWGSEISLSCTPPVLDPIYLLFCIFKIQDNICFFLGNMNYNLSLLNDKEFCFFLIGLNSIFSTLPQSEYTSCEVYSGLPTDQPKSRCKLEAPRSLYSSPGYNNNISQ